MVGASLTPGLFRAYSYSGGVKWSGVRRSNGVNWSPFTLQPCEWNGGTPIKNEDTSLINTFFPQKYFLANP